MGPEWEQAFRRSGSVSSQTCLCPSWATGILRQRARASGPLGCSAARGQQCSECVSESGLCFRAGWCVTSWISVCSLSHNTCTNGYKWKHFLMLLTHTQYCTHCSSPPPTHSSLFSGVISSLALSPSPSLSHTRTSRTPVGLHGSLQDTFESWAHRKSN